MQDFSSLDTARNAGGTFVAPARGWRGAVLRFKAFYLSPRVPAIVRVKRAVWSAVGLAVAALVVQGMPPSRPSVVVAPSTFVAPPPAPVPPVAAPSQTPLASQYTGIPEKDLNAKRDAWVSQTQAMAADAEKRAPGSVGAYQARSFATFLAEHCGKPGGCLKK
ncbi:hypothetical protein [Paraburkholderia sp. C35]|uniref:hypothetical protein n=1 Tax=Paraburkholderia sp. C35 TaxID=2126993 RepID=UPI000D6913B2|nr:hypothetical protein [Paraburkholderia sp. C35]